MPYALNKEEQRGNLGYQNLPSLNSRFVLPYKRYLKEYIWSIVLPVTLMEYFFLFDLYFYVEFT